MIIKSDRFFDGNELTLKRKKLLTLKSDRTSRDLLDKI